MNFKIAIACLIFSALCLSCDEGTPLESRPPLQSITTPRLIPLAVGASWEYIMYFCYESRGSSYGPCTTIKEYGKLAFEVIQESVAAGFGEYRLWINFKLDSLYTDHSQECGYYLRPGDTTFTRYNLLDTTYSRTIVYSSDTLWYKAADSLFLLMPDSAVAGSMMNLEIFNAAGRYEESFYWLPSYHSSLNEQHMYKGEWHASRDGHPVNNEHLLAIVRPVDGGLYSLVWSTSPSHPFIRRNNFQLQYTLRSYTPSTP